MPAQAVSPPGSPAACIDSLRAYARTAYVAARAANQPPDLDAIDTEEALRARRCAAAIDPSNTDPSFGLPLGVLFLVAREDSAADRTFAHVIDAPALSDSMRAMTIVAAMQAWSVARDSQWEASETAALLARLDAMPGVPTIRLEGHAMLIGRYEDADDDVRLVASVRAIRALIPALGPAERLAHASSIVAAFRSEAKLQGNALHIDSALATLDEASRLLPGVADSLGVADDRRLYRLVGQHAPPIHADYWLNGAATPFASTTASVLFFTANWCHSCRDAYPALRELDRRYGPRGMRYTLLVDLDGVFEGVAMPPAQEVEANRRYYVAQERFTAPIAIQRSASLAAEGDGSPPSDLANDEAYALRFLPHIVVVDRHGIIRGILQGWDPYGHRGRSLEVLVERALASA